MKRMVAMIAALSLALAGCAQIHIPAVALDGMDRAKYETDLAQCRSEASENAPSVPEGILRGAFIGAAVGAVIVLFAAANSPPPPAAGIGAVFAAVAAAGAVLGAFTGAAVAGEKTTDAIDGCLRQHGYRVGAENQD